MLNGLFCYKILLLYDYFDRSVEALDTALWRRFSFEFMPPLDKLISEDLEGVLTNPQKFEGQPQDN